MPPEHPTISPPHRRPAFVPPGPGKQWPWKQVHIGFFAFVLFSLLASATALWSIDHFEQRLDKSAREDLASAGVSLDDLSFDWNYRDLSLTGEIPGGIGEQQIIDVLRATDGGGIRNIELQLTTVTELPRPTETKGTIDVSAVLNDGVLSLTGSVLTEAHREQLYAAATQAVGAANVVRQIGVSGLQEAIPGSDQRIESFANTIAGLNKATSADAGLSATDLRFNATVIDESEVDELLRRRGSAGDVGLVISGDIIAKKSVPGGVVDVSAVKKDDRIVLSGVVTSEIQKQSLSDAAASVAGEALLDNQITVVASEDDAGFSDQKVAVLAAAIATFPKTIDASARVTFNEFDFDALVEFEEDTVALYSVRNTALESNLKISGEIESKRMSLEREVALLQSEIDALESEIRENVVFESSRSELGFEAKKTLDKVVDAMNRYQRPVVLVAGHTDSSGSSIDNELLSLERATAVRVYLEISGIDQLRLRSIGFGEGLPISSNDTAFGKKQNRRVEFSVRGNFD